MKKTKMTNRKIKVFYSWQSDLPDETNRRLIREAIRVASSQIEEEFASDGLQIDQDEATRDCPGSPNIPLTILQKVKSSDIFVCDITTINKEAPLTQRRVPNPNVLIELGYAIAHLDWGRIIMLFNRAHGTFPDDAPFDIDRHRASPYEFSKQNEDLKKLSKKEIRQLKEPIIELLYTAMREIIVKWPEKPGELAGLTPEQKKRRHDIQTLSYLLRTIHVPTLDEHIQSAPHKILHRIFFFWEGFHSILSSSLFYFYDAKLKSLILHVHDAWNKSLSYGQHYNDSPGRSSYYVFDSLMYGENEKHWKEIEKAIQDLNKSLQGLLIYIRDKYIEVDPEETSSYAWQNYLDWNKKFDAKFGRSREFSTPSAKSKSKA